MKLYYNNKLYHSDEFLQWWMFTKMTNIYHKYKSSSIDEFSWPWWIFIVLLTSITIKNNHQLMKFYYNDQFNQQDEFSLQHLILIESQWLILLHQWICIPMMNFHHNYWFSSHRWIFIIVKNFVQSHYERYYDAQFS